MSIYDNNFNEEAPSKSKKPSQKVDVTKIRNDKDLTSLVKQMKTAKKLKTGKEILYDTDGDIVGILQRNNDVYLFSMKEQEEFLSLYNS